MRFAKRVGNVSSSPTLALDAKTKELIAQGLDIISFGVGEPDFDTPAHIKEAGIKAINDNFTHYPPNAGIPDLRAAICKKLKEDNGLEYKPNQVLVSCGAKHSIFNAIMALVDAGDEAIVPSPYWVSYPEMVRIAGGTPVVVTTTEKDQFKITKERLEAAITPRTTCMFLNSPSNPTGAVYTKEELTDIAEVCKKHDIWIVSDEIYEKLMYDNAKHISIASISEDAKKRTITVNGVSKAYAMTGWRIGYAAGEPAIIKAMADIQSHATSAASGISQKASVAGLVGPQKPLADMLEEFKKRALYMHERINKMPGFYCGKPLGAFYVFPNISGLIGKSIDGKVITDGDTLCDILLDKAKVAIIPGSGFGNKENIRLSYATSMDLIVEGLNRVEAVLKTAK